jgi:hypothetical protein
MKITVVLSRGMGRKDFVSMIQAWAASVVWRKRFGQTLKVTVVFAVARLGSQGRGQNRWAEDHDDESQTNQEIHHRDSSSLNPGGSTMPTVSA